LATGERFQADSKGGCFSRSGEGNGFVSEGLLPGLTGGRTCKKYEPGERTGKKLPLTNEGVFARREDRAQGKNTNNSKKKINSKRKTFGRPLTINKGKGQGGSGEMQRVWDAMDRGGKWWGSNSPIRENPTGHGSGKKLQPQEKKTGGQKKKPLVGLIHQGKEKAEEALLRTRNRKNRGMTLKPWKKGGTAYKQARPIARTARGGGGAKGGSF